MENGITWKEIISCIILCYIRGGGFYKDGKKDGRWKEPDLLRYYYNNFVSLIVYHVGDYKDDIKVGEWIIWKQNSAIRKYN